MIQILPLEQIDAIEPLWIKLNELHKTFDLLINTQPRSGTWADRKNGLLLKCTHGHLLQVAWIDDALIGYCFTSLGKGGIGEIDSVYVEPQARKQGIGRRFVEAALHWLVEQGCEDIQLWVHRSNTEATAFYGRLGFTAGPQMQEFTETLLLWTPLCGATEG